MPVHLQVVNLVEWLLLKIEEKVEVTVRLCLNPCYHFSPFLRSAIALMSLVL